MVATSFWIVIEQGVEYNDSTYDIAGGAKVAGNAFPTREEAEKEAKKRLKDLLSGFRLTDFEEGYGYFTMKDRSEVVDEYMAGKGIETYESYGRLYYKNPYGLGWDDFIQWCEDKTYSWASFAPDLITVQEVKV